MNKPILVLAGAAALLAATPSPSPSPTPLPTPPPLNAPAAPTQAATNQPVNNTGPAAATPTPNAALDTLMKTNGAKSTPAPKGSGTPSPPPDDRKGIEGVWELQIQRGASTTYEHFQLKQSGTALTGTYLDGAGKKYPLAGSLDGTAVRMVVSMADGSTILLEGKIDGTTDMLGMLTDAKERVPFTAAYRPKEKWFDNVNPAPGGMGGGGYGPPR